MREIKFRAWNTDENKWWYMTLGDVLNLHSQNLALGNLAGSNFAGDRWCEYTGLKDKNGVEIYEGDILSFNARANYLNVDDEGIAEVYWYSENDHAGYWIKRPGGFDYSIDILCGQDYEVIGNIYENKELLT